MRLHLLLWRTGVVQKSSGDSRDEPVQKIVIDSRTVPVEKVVRVTLLARRKRENVKRVLKDFPTDEERNAKQSTSRNRPVSIHCFSLEVTTSLWSGRRGCLRRWERFDPRHADTFSGSFRNNGGVSERRQGGSYSNSAESPGQPTRPFLSSAQRHDFQQDGQAVSNQDGH